MQKGIVSYQLSRNHPILQRAVIDGISTYFNNEDTSIIDQFQYSPYQLTLYLHPNCYPIQSVLPIFKILKRFDLILTYDFTVKVEANIPNIPVSFPFFSDAILGVQKGEKINQFLNIWQKNLLEGQENKQALRSAVWASDLNYYVLPPEWNIKQEDYLQLWELQEALPKIINTSNLMVYYQHWYQSFRITDQLRYRWRKMKAIIWELKHF